MKRRSDKVKNKDSDKSDNSNFDIDLKDLEVKELGGGEFGCTYLVKNNNKKYIFKFTFENVRFRLGFKYKGKDFKFTKPGETEYYTLKKLKGLEGIPKMYFYKNDISIKDKYIDKFDKIKDFVHSEDQKNTLHPNS